MTTAGPDTMPLATTLTAPPVGLALHAALAAPGDAALAWDRLRTTVNLDNCWDRDIIRLLPLVGHNLAEVNPAHPDLPRLRGVQRSLWVQGQHQAAAIDALVTALADAGITARVAGGLALARRCYPTLGHRPLDDTAVVVTPRSLTAATRVALATGWVRQRRPVHQRLWWLAAARLTTTHFPAMGPVTGNPLAPRRLSRTDGHGTATAILCVAPNPWGPDAGPDTPDRPGTPDTPDTPDTPGPHGTDVTTETQLVATLAGGATAVAPRGSGWVADTVHLLCSDALDPARVAAEVDRWQVGALVAPRLAAVARAFGTTRDHDLAKALSECRSTRRARWAARHQGMTNG